MSRDKLAADEPFSYLATKSGLVQISCNGRIVTTLSGGRASRFLSRIDAAGGEGAQLLMARATGHFKHGSERVSSKRRVPS